MLRYCFLLLLPVYSFAQKKDKADKIAFCGVQMKSKEKIQSYFQPQFNFLNINENDTIVDIGAGSGWYEGAFSSISKLKNISFVLVDIDSRCLNQQKVNNMIAHYSQVKGETISNHFLIVQNTADSLWLPLNTYKKIWLMNTLHEIPDQNKMLTDIYSVLKKEGEVFILENIPEWEGQLHGGCNKPLLSFEKIKQIFKANGFVFKEKIDLIRKRNAGIQMLRFAKN